MNRCQIQIVSTMGLLASMANAQADSTGFAGALGVQYKQLTMDQTFEGIPGALGVSGNGELSADLAVMNVQAIVFHKSFYLSAKLETNLKTSSTSSSIPFTTADTSLKSEVARDDASFTVGYRINHAVSLFGGYMMGETELTPNTCGNCTNLASVMQRDGYGTYRQYYREKGFFTGVSLGMRFLNGRISTSIAYALMDGEYVDNYQDSNGSYEFNYQGDSTGASVAIAWDAPLTESLFYFLDARVQQYEMEADNHAGTGIYQDTNVNTRETISGVSGGLRLIF